jgi:hypothetical protein
MQTGTVEYGTYKNGSSVYKDKTGYYIIDISDNGKGEEYKKYLKNWKPDGTKLYLDKSKGKNGKWSRNKSVSTNTKKKGKTEKYKNRPSPSYPANEWCGKNKKGNDGNMYVSKLNKNDVCRWIKI